MPVQYLDLRDPAGPTGPAAISSIPGEVKLWPGGALPEITYGTWVWADGGVYVVADHPIAAGHIAPAWRTFAGATDPGAPNFRVPDMRGLVAAGLDQMPGGARANRMTRAVAITIAGKTGEETHVITIPEMPSHTHGIDAFGHSYVNTAPGATTAGTYDFASTPNNPNAGLAKATGGGGAHENVQPTVFVPYIVFLDG